MFDPLKKISHHQKLGIGSYLGGHTKAQSEKMPKSYISSTGIMLIVFSILKNKCGQSV